MVSLIISKLSLFGSVHSYEIHFDLSGLAVLCDSCLRLFIRAFTHLDKLIG
jgi:hypothetical protein